MFLFPSDRDVFNGHSYRIGLQLHLEVEDRSLQLQIVAQRLSEIVLWQTFGVIRGSGAIGPARNSGVFYRAPSLS